MISPLEALSDENLIFCLRFHHTSKKQNRVLRETERFEGEGDVSNTLLKEGSWAEPWQMET